MEKRIVRVQRRHTDGRITDYGERTQTSERLGNRDLEITSWEPPLPDGEPGSTLVIDGKDAFARTDS